MNEDQKFDQLTIEMVDKLLENNPDYATGLGLHDPYDYLLPRGDTKRLVRNLELEEEWLKRLKETVSKEGISEDHKLDWEILERLHRNSEFQFHEQRMHELNPDALDLIGGLVFVMLTRDYAPMERRMDAIASRLEHAPRYFEEFRSRFEKSKPVRLWTEIAIESAENMEELFDFLLQAAKGRISDKTLRRLSNAVETLKPELEIHLKWLNNLLARTVEDWALGRERFERLIELRDLGMTSEEILKLGERYLKRLKVKRTQLARQIAPRSTEKSVLEEIESDAPETFEEALMFTEKTMEEAKKFVQEKNLAMVYPQDKLYVRETPAFIAPLIPFAALMMPAKYDKPQIGIYIVTRPKDPANLSNHLNYKSIRNTAVHEAFPGHFLQGACTNRGSIIRILADGHETTEGWAHYCEEVMTEKGFIMDSETKFIQTNDMIWRAVRIIVDVKLSRGEMTFDEAVNLLVKETGMSKEAATAEVRRYTQYPGYQLSYLLGKHLIQELKDEIRQKMGSKFDERFFHDTIAANGYLPISIVRKVFQAKLGT